MSDLLDEYAEHAMVGVTVVFLLPIAAVWFVVAAPFALVGWLASKVPSSDD